MRKLALVLTCAAVVVSAVGYGIYARAQASGCKLVVEAAPSQLWPPNDRMVPVHLVAYCNDPSYGCPKGTPCGCCESFYILGVESNELLQPGVDFEFTNTQPVPQLLLRATRAEEGNGRTYSIHVQEYNEYCCNPNTFTVTVTVPHDQKKR